MTGSTVLCRVEDIPDGDARGFTLDGAGAGAGGETGGANRILVARRGPHLFGYRNVCPHAGTPLDWTEGRFMSFDRTHLLCGTHGALFRVEDGLCVLGPCLGRALTPVALRIENGTVHAGG